MPQQHCREYGQKMLPGPGNMVHPQLPIYIKVTSYHPENTVEEGGPAEKSQECRKYPPTVLHTLKESWPMLWYLYSGIIFVLLYTTVVTTTGAVIQRRGSILAFIVICLFMRRHNCRSQVIDLSLSALISWFMKPIIGVLNNSNLHAIISALLIINLY
jgi:hypothetical protein